MAFVILLPVVALCAVWVFGTSRAVADKRGLQNTLDAMTYSASVVMARNLNYLAYTNRAMAANEAGIATVASMQTSTGAVISGLANGFEAIALAYGIDEIDNLAQAADWAWLPPQAMVYLAKAGESFANAHRYGRWADRTAKLGPVVARPFQAFADVLRTLNYGIAASQSAMYGATIAAVPDTIESVRRANDPQTYYIAADAALSTASFVAQFAAYIRPYHQTAKVAGTSPEALFQENLRFAYAARQSRDDFTSKRRILPTLFDQVPGVGQIGKLLGQLVTWKGGTEMVSETAGGGTRGRLRWQSADALQTPIPLNHLLGELPSPVTFGSADWKEFLTGRFTLGAAAASQSDTGAAATIDASWRGSGVTLPGEKTPMKKYGDINDESDGSVERAGFWRATRGGPGGNDRNIAWSGAPSALVPLRFDSRWRYGPRQGIGAVTREWYLPAFYDVRTHPRMVAFEADDWLGQQSVTGADPTQWGGRTDRGPALTLTLGKPGRPTDAVAGATTTIGNAAPLKALSAAQVYFRRPLDRWARKYSRDDKPDFVGSAGYVEHRSLFSPYWHAHHIQPSVAARVAARTTAWLETPAAGR